MLRIACAAIAALLLAGPAAVAGPSRDNAAAPREHAAPAPGATIFVYNIVVNKFGRRIRGSKGTSSFQSLPGRYIARFPADVTNCTYVATLGRATTDGGIDETAGFITAQRSSGFPDGVFVNTRGLGDRDRNRPFHLLVTC